MNNEMRMLIRNKLHLNVDGLWCDHDVKQPCKTCRKKIYGDVSQIYGYMGGIHGDVRGITGDVSGITGDVSGITGNVRDIREVLDDEEGRG